MAEVWKDIPGYIGYYQASNQGQVRSLDRIVDHSICKRKTIHGRVLKQARSRSYLTVSLCKNGTEQTWQVGNLVLLTFVGPRPYMYECCHNNGNPHDNHLLNLRYGTRSENSLDAVKHGTHAGLGRRGRKVIVINLGIVFNSASEAADYIGCSTSSVNKVCFGSRKSVYNFELKYI